MKIIEIEGVEFENEFDVCSYEFELEFKEFQINEFENQLVDEVDAAVEIEFASKKFEIFD